MATRERYFDPDPPEPGFPRPIGDLMGSLSSYRKTCEQRTGGSPASTDSPTFYRDLIILLAVKAGLPHRVVAKEMGLKRPTVTNLVAKMQKLALRRDSDD